MLVRLNISGGFAPSLTGGLYQVDASTLEPEAKTQLESLVHQVIQEPSPEINPRARDAQNYELQIMHDGNKQTITADDGTLTPTLRQIVKLIKTKASKV